MPALRGPGTGGGERRSRRSACASSTADAGNTRKRGGGGRRSRRSPGASSTADAGNTCSAR